MPAFVPEGLRAAPPGSDRSLQRPRRHAQRRSGEVMMIPGSFSYHRPASVADAVKLLSDLGEDARPLAGGHSLVPMMKLRLATPAHLIDLHGIAALKGIRRH